MDDSFYNKLSPFIREFIYKNRWEELKYIQNEACRAIFETNDHVLIASGTASGKTEAAFFPILTDLYNNPVNSIHTIYISPLKALINDQFLRLNYLIEEADIDIKIWQWHGDVSATHKAKLLKDPTGILQITPESLESILINKTRELISLFSNLKYIVIDEIHSFIGTERGLQVISLIGRISEMCNVKARRVGLSATLGSYEIAKNWLRMGTENNVSLIESSPKRNVSIVVCHFKDYKDEKNNEFNDLHYKFLYEKSLLKKAIIFTNSRSEAESAVYHLRKIAKNNGTVDNYHVHHGSISSILRKEAETSLKNDEINTVVAATLTLELGIDIGKLDRVFQIGSPFSCSSFVQRLGRSGRRTGKPEIAFINVEGLKNSEYPLSLLPWELLQIIAIIELYAKEHWIEPPKNMQYPFSLLYHQTISILISYGELPPNILAKKVLSLSPFENITIDDFKLFINHLIEINHIERMEDGKSSLIVGIEGEKIANNFHFYSVFKDSIDYKVLSKSEEIGTIESIPPIDSTILLAGKGWIVKEIDLEKKNIFVIESTGKLKDLWSGNAGEIHDKILKKIKEILGSSDEYSYLSKDASLRLSEARDYCKKMELLKSNIIPLSNNTICIILWVGTRKIETLRRMLENVLKNDLKIVRVSVYSPYYIIVETNLGSNLFKNKLYESRNKSFELVDLIDEDEELIINKYDEYVPRALRIKSYLNDFIDHELLENMKNGKLFF